MLTDVEASAAQASDRDYKLADANGLYLFVTRSGFKSWRMKYRFGGKEKRLTFGAYPEVSLSEARARRDEARALLRDNVDPGVEKQRLRAIPVSAEPLSATTEDQLPFDGAPGGYPARRAIEDEAFAAAPQAPTPPVIPAPIATIPPMRSAPPPDRPASKPLADAPGETAARQPLAPPAEDAPASEAETAAGSRAVSLLKQAERAAETAASQSRTARRVTIAVLALFVVMALALGWWLLSHPRGAAAAAGGTTSPLAGAPAVVGAAAVPGPVAVAHPTSPAAAAPSSTPPPAAEISPPAAPPGAPVRTLHGSGGRADAPSVAHHRHRGHHRHRHHGKRHGRHRHRHHAARAIPNSSSSIGRAHAARVTTIPSAQETYHAIDVVAPRGAAIDPALDRAGRVALCLRAAYSASPGCAAVR